MTRYTNAELKALGSVYRVLSNALPNGLTEMELEDACSHPVGRFARVFRRAMLGGHLSERDNDIISSLMDSIETHDTLPEPLSLDEQGKLMIGYYTMSTDLVSVKEAAEMLDMSTQRVYAIMHDGLDRLRAIIVNGKTMIPRHDVDKLARDKH